MRSTNTAVLPETDRPDTTRPAPVRTGRGAPPSTGTEYRWVQPRSRAQNSTSVPPAIRRGTAPG